MEANNSQENVQVENSQVENSQVENLQVDDSQVENSQSESSQVETTENAQTIEQIESLYSMSEKEDEEKAEEEKTEEDPESVVPETYDFEGVETENGIQLNDNDKAFLGNMAKEMSLTVKQAKVLAAKGSAMLHEHQLGVYAKTVNGWIESVRNDPNLGGNNFKTTQSNLRRAIDAYGDKEVVDFLNSTHLGDHPAVVRMFDKIGRSLREDNNFVQGEKPKKEQDILANFYYNSPELK